MFKNMLKVFFGLAVMAASALMPAHAGLVIKQDFWGVGADNVKVKFASLVIDPAEATQYVDNLYITNSWKSFTIFGREVVAYDFLAEFDMTNLYGGFTFLQFDVSDIDGIFNFFGIGFTDFGYFDLTLAAFDYNDPAGVVYAGDDILSSSTAVNAPASVALLLVGFAGLVLRRRQA